MKTTDEAVRKLAKLGYHITELRRTVTLYSDETAGPAWRAMAHRNGHHTYVTGLGWSPFYALLECVEEIEGA